MSWLLVTSGNWGYADHDRVMRSFPAGLYLDVDQETQDFVRRANSPQLLLGEGEPPEFAALVVLGQPVQLTNIRIPHDGRIVLAQPEVMEEIAEEQEDDRALDYPCAYCPERYPHSAPLRRHVALHHAVLVDEPPPEPKPEDPPLTDA